MFCPKCHHTNPAHQLLCSCCQQPLRLAKLRVVNHAGKEQYFELHGRDFTIGRQADNDLVLAEESVSRYHARLCFSGGVYFVEDLGSTNGLYINGEKVQSRQLVSLDCLQIGAARIYYVLSETVYFAAAGNRVSPPASNSLTSLSARTPAAQRSDAERLFSHVLHHLLQGALHLAQAQRATLWLPDTAGDLIPRLCANEKVTTMDSNAGAARWSPDLAEQQHLALRVYRSGGTIVREQREANERFCERLTSSSDLFYQQLGIPLRVNTETQHGHEAFVSRAPIGALVLECHPISQRLSPTKLACLQNLLEEAGNLVDRVQFITTALKESEAAAFSQTAETDLAIAVQQQLQPIAIPYLAGYDLGCWHHPAETVSGDYLDVVPLLSGEFLLVLGDVAGKGLAAATLINAMQISLHLLLTYENRLEKILAALNRIVHGVGAPSTFTTLFLGVLNPQRRTLHYVNAGHTPGLFIHSSDATPAIEFLHSNSAALGVLETCSVEVKQLRLPPASVLVLFTDGLTEAVNESGEYYGLTRLTERIVTAVLSARQASAAYVLETLREDLTLYSANFDGKVRHHDDQAALVLMVR
ncbi:SpoIIE family protein phosphatase [candidate division KSB1 bacterium]|nr:SpoIIE family protein phosphatase [candidate division KSB1 bacterium]